ncbi:hypothetical protein LCGC14_1930630, partial [marine sediment metagenome]
LKIGTERQEDFLFFLSLAIVDLEIFLKEKYRMANEKIKMQIILNDVINHLRKKGIIDDDGNSSSETTRCFL